MVEKNINNLSEVSRLLGITYDWIPDMNTIDSLFSLICILKTDIGKGNNL